MAYKNKADRKYGQAAQYEDTPEQVKNRMERNKARYKLLKEGKVKKGDGKDVSHKSNGKLTLEVSKSNRSRNGKGGGSTKL